uniref:Uncharacterized protein n=1 Tax=Vitis vinifera TaxID=29760 RepID=A5AM35_VITVI|nr:hypothetical protein VITISV_041857 [Vitis vinifera]
MKGKKNALEMLDAVACARLEYDYLVVMEMLSTFNLNLAKRERHHNISVFFIEHIDKVGSLLNGHHRGIHKWKGFFRPKVSMKITANIAKGETYPTHVYIGDFIKHLPFKVIFNLGLPFKSLESKSLPSVGYSRKSYLQVTSQRLAKGKLVHLHGRRSLALPSVGPGDSKVKTRSARFRRHTKRTEKSLRSKRLISQRCEVSFQFAMFGFQRVANIGKLQEEFHNTMQNGFASKRFLFASSPCIPDLLMAKDFKALVLHVSELSIALPWIPNNSPQSRISLCAEDDRHLGIGAPKMHWHWASNHRWVLCMPYNYGNLWLASRREYYALLRHEWMHRFHESNGLVKDLGALRSPLGFGYFKTPLRKMHQARQEARSFLEKCISTSSEHHLHRDAINWRRQAFFIVVFYMSTPMHHISIEKQQLIKATHRLVLNTDQSPPLSFSTLHRNQWHTSWRGTSRTHPLAVPPLDLDFFFDNNNNTALHETFMFNPNLDGVGFDFTFGDLYFPFESKDFLADFPLPEKGSSDHDSVDRSFGVSKVSNESRNCSVESFLSCHIFGDRNSDVSFIELGCCY